MAAMVRHATPSVVAAVTEYVTASRRSTQPPFRHDFVIHDDKPFGNRAPARRSVIDSLEQGLKQVLVKKFGAAQSVVTPLVLAAVGVVVAGIVGVMTFVRGVVVVRGRGSSRSRGR